MIEKYQLPNELAFDELLIYKDLKYRANLAARTKNSKHKLDHNSQ
jgi:hypothetical protein